MNLPKLSYVLLSHNREKYIRGAIESAFAQDYEGELEYIFSDDTLNKIFCGIYSLNYRIYMQYIHHLI